ncbi:MAG: hypothetical protein KW806_01550 [Candidatus Yanofskybacteria bacterium]|nr:hypothetical protein [Candidatus Yanofskybacteria bacterium]
MRTALSIVCVVLGGTFTMMGGMILPRSHGWHVGGVVLAAGIVFLIAAIALEPVRPSASNSEGS